MLGLTALAGAGAAYYGSRLARDLSAIAGSAHGISASSGGEICPPTSETIPGGHLLYADAASTSPGGPGWDDEDEPNFTDERTTVIGRVKDLQNLGSGEASLLNRLPNRGSPRANWRQNAGVLRAEMRRGRPIRDASPGDNGGQFLNAERYLLQQRGWTFDPATNFWMPPPP
jgi:hypothetical protein